MPRFGGLVFLPQLRELDEVFTTDIVQRVIAVKLKPMTSRWFGFKDLDYFHPEIWGSDASTTN